MRRERVLVTGGREVRATLDAPDGESEDVVVACPPHPRHGGARSDLRLRAVSERLVEDGIACLRFDYGPWAGGVGEVKDAEDAVRWAAGRFDRVGLFGYSFGGGVAALAAASTGPLQAVSLLAPVSRPADDLDVVTALAAVDERNVPGQVVYGTRDESADWRPVAERARDLGWTVEAVEGGHLLGGLNRDVAERTGDFLARRLHPD